MKKRYELLLALDTRGKEDNAKDIIERIEKELASEGAVLEQTQRLEKREFAYEHNHATSAYFVNFILEIEAAKLDSLRAKFKLDEEISLYNFIVLPSKAAAPAVA